MAKLVELIEAEESVGSGFPDDPSRVVTRWYTKDGALVVERDAWKERMRNEPEVVREISIAIGADDLVTVDRKGDFRCGHTYRFVHYKGQQ